MALVLVTGSRLVAPALNSTVLLPLQQGIVRLTFERLFFFRLVDVKMTNLKNVLLGKSLKYTLPRGVRETPPRWEGEVAFGRFGGQTN
jgi:hypothetical protein